MPIAPLRRLLDATRAEAMKAAASGPLRVAALAALAAAVLVAFGMGIFAHSLIDRGRPDGVPVVLAPDSVGMGWLRVGLPILLIAAAASITRERETRTEGPTYLAVPRRWVVVLAKWLVFGSLTAAMTAAALTLTPVLGAQAAGIPSYSPGRMLTDGGARFALVVALLTLPACAVAMLLGALLRNTAAAVLGVLGWQLVVEEGLRAVPGVGDVIAPALPMNQIWHVAGAVDLGGPLSTPTGVSSAYLGVLTALALAAAGRLLSSRAPR